LIRIARHDGEKIEIETSYENDRNESRNESKTSEFKTRKYLVNNLSKQLK
jgi:hypothetical protein